MRAVLVAAVVLTPAVRAACGGGDDQAGAAESGGDFVRASDPRPEVPLLAVDALRDTGARRVVLGGASYGGALAMSVAHEARPPVSGVLSLGGELSPPGTLHGVEMLDGPDGAKVRATVDHFLARVLG